MNPLDPFYASYSFGNVFDFSSSVVEPILPENVKISNDYQRYFLSLPEQEQQQILRECRKNIRSIRHCIEDKQKRE